MQPTRPGRRGPVRDRRGRGLRGPLAVPAVPAMATRAERFDDHVLDAVERLQGHLPDLATVDVVVADVPPEQVLADGGVIPLGRAEPATAGRPARLVVYRRTVELRAEDAVALADLVRDVVAELVADVFGLTPEQVDPDYDDPDEQR